MMVVVVLVVVVAVVKPSTLGQENIRGAGGSVAWPFMEAARPSSSHRGNIKHHHHHTLLLLVDTPPSGLNFILPTPPTASPRRGVLVRSLLRCIRK
ncbi:hypothetical protein E2C01_073368 [Portunus trituberculatus]|uniref:Secreted protein n=1 Tax=Portunus trituberculatus TaxID=210409 RepID=A0A5B7IAE1_PORTR|nr:hypothetical protein [Portunus trituberculatus]